MGANKFSGQPEQKILFFIGQSGEVHNFHSPAFRFLPRYFNLNAISAAPKRAVNCAWGK